MTIILPLCGCCLSVAGSATAAAPIDAKATRETKALFHSMRAQMGKGIMFGQQNATLYGIGWHARRGAPQGKCDTKIASGKYPAVYGWDLNTIWNVNDSREAAKKKMGLARKLVVDAVERGGVNTFSWHMWNPVTKKSFYDRTRAMKTIIPGGSNHAWYKKQLDVVAEFFKSIKTRSGVPVPVIFRPFHEHNLKAFWWCVPNCSQAEYNEAFRFTVKYLRDVKGVHNLLYAISPSGKKIIKAADYLKLFPGKDYVDLYGIDYYTKTSNAEALPSLRVAVQLADKDGKIAALTEGGYRQGISEAPADHYTNGYIGPFKKDPVASRIAYFLVWQNAKMEQHWVPVKGDKQLQDFKKFAKDPAVIFGDRVRSMYTVKK